MSEHTGWLLDVYAGQEGGIVLWLLTDEDQRLRLRMDFPVTLYVTGDVKLLRQAWIYLKEKDVKLDRVRRRDLFAGECDVMSVTVANPSRLSGLFMDLSLQFPALDYYDADIPICLRFIARTKSAPKVIGGTKAPSMTSRCNQSAPAAVIALVSSARAPQSEASMEGAMIVMSL